MSERSLVNIRRMIGMSDLSTLLSIAFSFPKDEDLATGLQNGSFIDDWRASWKDANATAGESGSGACEDDGMDDMRTVLSQADHVDMKREFSRLFLSPGTEVPVWPYESAFLHRLSDRKETPNLFRTQGTIDVETQMAAAGVRPAHLRTEPCDNIATELEFLSYLYAQLGEALRLESEDLSDGSAGERKDHLISFVTTHAKRWFTLFFADVQRQSRIETYRVLAQLGSSYSSLLEENVAWIQETDLVR